MSLEMFSGNWQKLERRYNVRKRESIRFQWCYICPDTWNIERDMTILRKITGNGKSVRRAFRKGLLTSSETSYECPVYQEIFTGSTFILNSENKFNVGNYLRSFKE